MIRFSELKQLVRQFPLKSGVYIMYNSSGEVIYVGKAISLRKRLLNYFRTNLTDTKTKCLVHELYDISYKITDTEAEALILEEKLIKKYRPRYNILLKDDKTYPLVRIEIENGVLPRVSIVRRPKALDNSMFFGPFPSVKLLRLGLKGLRYIYPYRSCSNFRNNCIYAHIGLCLAPCKNSINEEEINYVKDGLLKVFNGDCDVVVKALFSRMNEASSRCDFESAAFFRDSALALNALFCKGILGQKGILAVYDLKERLGLPVLPRRIEGFDVSNIQGDCAVGSMVLFCDGLPFKKGYRRYRIKSVKGINDVQMIYEIVKRRCRRLSMGEGEMPDVFLIDGGIGHLKAAHRALIEKGLNISLMALAKKREAVYVLWKKKPVILARETAALKLLQAVRDEAHRFAITYHRKRRQLNLLQ